MEKLLSTSVGKIFWTYSSAAGQRTVLYQNEDLETSAYARDITGIPSFKSQFKNQEAWCYLALSLLWVSRLLQTMPLPYIFFPFTSVKVWELRTGTHLRMQTWSTKPYESTTTSSPTAVGHVWTWSEGQARGSTPEESVYETSSVIPLTINCAKTSELHSLGMALVIFIWGHLSTSKEELMCAISLCYIHLLTFVRQLLRQPGIHEKQLNLCDFY